MATISEHVASVQAAIKAARDDGYLTCWDFTYDSCDMEVKSVDLSFYRVSRGADGFMRVVEMETILAEDI
jgi:hypothetical protein